MRLSTYHQIILEVAAWCHDLGHTGMKDKNQMPLVQKYKGEQKELGREVSTKIAVEELKEKGKVDINEFQPYETRNISSAINIFVTAINKKVPALAGFTKEFPRAIDQIISIISESFHPRFYDPKSKTGDWVPSEFGKIFRAADALPCFVWFKYENEGREVYFEKIIAKEVYKSESKRLPNGTDYTEVTLINFEQSWFEQVVGIYLEEKFGGNRKMYEGYVRRKDAAIGLYLETLEEYFKRVIADTEIGFASNNQITSGSQFFTNVINFERIYVKLLDEKVIPLYIEPAYDFFKEVKPMILQDLAIIEKYVADNSPK